MSKLGPIVLGVQVFILLMVVAVLVVEVQAAYFPPAAHCPASASSRGPPGAYATTPTALTLNAVRANNATPFATTLMPSDLSKWITRGADGKDGLTTFDETVDRVSNFPPMYYKALDLNSAENKSALDGQVNMKG